MCSSRSQDSRAWIEECLLLPARGSTLEQRGTICHRPLCRADIEAGYIFLQPLIGKKLVLMVELGISVEDITRELEKRHVVDHKVKQERMQ